VTPLRLIFRVRPESRLTVPLLANIWAGSGLAREARVAYWIEQPPTDLGPGDAILYSFMTPHLPRVAAEVARLRREFAGRAAPLFVAGGAQASGDPALTLAAGFDGVVTGAGEEGLPAFGRQWLDGTLPEAPWTIARGGSLAGFFPLADGLPTVPPLEIMRGCHWRCRFCQTGSQPVEYRSRAEIEAFLDRLAARGLRRVGFIAPSALEFGSSGPGRVDLPSVSWLLEAARRRGFPFIEYGIFPSEIRPDTVSAPLLALLKGVVSNRSLTFGAQSGDEGRLAAEGRGHGLDAVERALELAAEAGFTAALDFIFAYPGETPVEREATVAAIRSLHRRYGIRAQCHHFVPLAGSASARRLPSFLGEEGRAMLEALHRDGIATDWWREGERTATRLLEWLRTEHPAFYGQYRP